MSAMFVLFIRPRNMTEILSVMVIITASYSWGPRFKFWLGGYCDRFFLVLYWYELGSPPVT